MILRYLSVVCSILGVPGSLAPDFTDALLTYGAVAASIDENVPEGGIEQPIIADPQRDAHRNFWLRAVWQHCRVVALFKADRTQADAQAIIQASAATAGVGESLDLTWADVYDEDWEAQIRASYVPIQLTEHLCIVPEWCEVPDPANTNILLRPGIAFGTGEHPTTRLCLRSLERATLRGRRVIDYGCGSGILTLAASKFGASHVVAVDTDAMAVRAATLNAALNGCEASVTVLQADPFLEDEEPLATSGVAASSRQFDVCVANILKPALLDLQPRLSAYVCTGGTIMLSGILEHQVHDVQAAYSADFHLFEKHVEDGWALLCAKRLR